MLKIVENDISLIQKFIDLSKNIEYFTYFQNHNVKELKNHLITIVVLYNKEVAGYGHLDKDINNIVWLGLCVLKEFQNKSIGKSILKYLINYIEINKISEVQLSVDIQNSIAIYMYHKYNFKISEIVKKKYIMKYQNYIKLKISIGEALDKLSILEIKNNKIDNKNVLKEYIYLKSILNSVITENAILYRYLTNINKVIWNQMDEIKQDKIDNKLFTECILANDIRYRIKNKINLLSFSEFQEQKSYKKKSIGIDFDEYDSPEVDIFIKKLSLLYDIIYIKNKNLTNYVYDKTIIVVEDINIDNILYNINDNIFKKFNHILCNTIT
jgi:hypothetical protein